MGGYSDLEVVTVISLRGFGIHLCSVPGVEFALEFFAVGVGGYHLRGQVCDVMPSGGHYSTFREVPFFVLEVGISEVRVGCGASEWIRQIHDANFDRRFALDDPFEGNRVPEGPVSIGGR